MTNKTYDFGEKTVESYKTKEGWQNLPVIHHPKYKASKEKAIDLINNGDFGLDEADFWILKNASGNGDKAKLYYTGLIISHNGCLKINAKLDKDKKFKPECADVYKDVNGDIVMRYVCPEQGLYEFGEVSPKNCKNEYPYAMALKRLQDRVILKTSEIAFFGIYSDSESDSFKESQEEGARKQFLKKPDGPLALVAEQGDREMKELKAKKKENDNEKKQKDIDASLNRLKSTLNGFGSISEIEGYLQQIPEGNKLTRLQAINRMDKVNAAQAKTIITNAKLAIDPEYKGELRN